ncbi:hypothetical protein ES708_28781 [subsurface metagenome]
MKKCPRCGMPKMQNEDALNSLSRRDSKTYICNDCGMEEAMIDLGERDVDERERKFVKTHKAP